jgi:pimeloyl-ACP methyl ester carboxylesterase
VLSILIGIVTVGALLYAGLGVLLYLTQEGAIFYPGPNDEELRRKYAPGHVEIPTPGAKLEGWWIENPSVTNDLVIVYFGGNAEDVLYTADTENRLNARRMLVTNYRGYGSSSGKPGQEALYQDGLAIYEYVLSTGIREDQIVLVGRSLGSGVVSMLAGTRKVRAAILITPFDSLTEVAAGHYPYFPVRLLLRHPFPSNEWARKAREPALILSAAEDTIIPPSHARSLMDAWAGEARLHVFAGVGHNDIQLHPDYYRLINEFLAAQLTP